MHRTLLREELDDEEAKNLGLTKKEEGDRKKKKSRKAGSDKRDGIKGPKVKPAREGMCGSAVNPSAEQIATQSNLPAAAAPPQILPPPQQAYWAQQQQQHTLTLAQQAQLHYQQQLPQQQQHWQIPPPPSHPSARGGPVAVQYQPQATPPRQIQYQQQGQFTRNQFGGPPSFALPQGTSQIMTHGVTQGIPQGIPQGVPQGMPQALPQGVPQGMQQALPQGVPQGISQEVPQGAQQGIQPGIPQSLPQGMSQGIQQVPQGIPQGVPQGTHPSIPQGVPQQVVQQNGQKGMTSAHQRVVRSHSVPNPVEPRDDHIHSEKWLTGNAPVAHLHATSSQGNTMGDASWVNTSVDSHDSSWANSSADDSRWKTSDNVHEGQWATFPPPAEDKTESDDELEYAEHSSDEIESSDEETPSGSPVLFGEEGDVLLRAPSLTSFAESTSSMEEEGEENPWVIQPEQKDYYTKQFQKLQPMEDGVVKGPKARDFFLKSNLPTEVLSRIWQLSDVNKDNALNLDEFCIAMHLVVALRHGLDLPAVLPGVLLPHRDVHNGPGIVRQTSIENNSQELTVITEKHWTQFSASAIPVAAGLAKFTDSHQVGSADCLVTFYKIFRFVVFSQFSLLSLQWVFKLSAVDDSVAQPIPVRQAEATEQWHRQDMFAATRPRSQSDPSSPDDHHEAMPRKASLRVGHLHTRIMPHSEQLGHPQAVLPPPPAGVSQGYSQVAPPALPPPPPAGGLLQTVPHGNQQAGPAEGVPQGPHQVPQGTQVSQVPPQVPQGPLQLPQGPAQLPQVSPQSQQPEQPLSPVSNDKTVSRAISRPRATIKPSLLDAGPEQLLPPPSGKFSWEGWTPTKITHSSHTVSSPPPPLSPIATGPSLSPPPGMSSPPPPTSSSPMPQVTNEQMETPPSSPVVKTPTQTPPQSPPQSPTEDVVRRQPKRTGERPRSTGDVKVSSQSDASIGSSEGSIKSEGKKEMPPPPPPRNKRGHSRSSSLDLNKLFAAKAKESTVATSSASSSHSSHSSQASSASAPARDYEQDLQRGSETQPTPDKIQEGNEAAAPPSANFADFSKFESFMQAQSSSTESQSATSTSSNHRSHRRSMSVDHVSALNWPSDPVQQPTHCQAQEALPRPVAKMQPPNPLALKVTRRPERTDKEAGGETEKKLKTNPPKVVVRPLTKEDVLHSKIRDLKDKNVTLSRVNGEMQQELKEVMEMRVALELQLEQLRPFSAQ